MNPTQEKALLTMLIKKLDQTDTGIIGSRFFLPTLWAALVVAFTVMFHLADSGSLSNLLLVVIAGVIGAFIGWIFLPDIP